MQEAEAVRFGRSSNLKGLIEVSQLIAQGLHPRPQ
jgi:flagellar biosynthesis regulator FlaF